jgi:hypothetical protein
VATINFGGTREPVITRPEFFLAKAVRRVGERGCHFALIFPPKDLLAPFRPKLQDDI